MKNLTRSIKWPVKLPHTIKFTQKQIDAFMAASFDDLRGKYYVGHSWIKFQPSQKGPVAYVNGLNMGALQKEADLEALKEIILSSFKNWLNESSSDLEKR